MEVEKTSGKVSEKVIEKVMLIPIEEICPFPEQPREYFNQEKLRALASSISTAGQITPGRVIKLPQGSPNKYQLVDGQRRWHALKMAGIACMKAIVDTTIDNENDQFMISVLSNLCKEDHTPLEIARAIKRLRNNGISWKIISNIFGHSEMWAVSHCKILDLHPNVLEMLSPTIPEEKQLSFTTAVALTELSKEIQEEVARKIISNGWGTIRAKAFIRKMAKKEGTYNKPRGHSPRKDHEKLVNFANKLILDIETFISEPQKFFNEMFLYRKAKDCERMAELLREGITNLGFLYKAVLKAGEVKAEFDEKLKNEDFQARLDAKIAKARSQPRFNEAGDEPAADVLIFKAQ